MEKPIVFWGASGHAKVLREFMDKIGYRLVALFDNCPSTPKPFPDVPLFYSQDGFRAWREQEKSRSVAGLVAIGGSRGRDRLQIQRFMAENGVEPIVAVHPTAFVAGDARLGAGSQVLAQAAVCTEVRIGPASIINTRASVDHESELGVAVHVSPGATLAGCVQIGDYSFIGSGAIVLPRVRVGQNVVIGAGAVVTKDVPDDCVAYGNPARIIRENK